VSGIGGIGKTTIVRTYVERHWAGYYHLAWLTVTSPQSIGNDPVARLAEAGYSPLRDAFLRDRTLWTNLGIGAAVEQHIAAKDLAAAFALIFQRLGQLENCLLVVDNANDVADLLDNRPALKTLTAQVLVTSRAKPKGWDTVPVDELPLPLAVKLFRQHYSHPSLAQAADADLNALSETLLRHTLLLELVGKSASPEGANLSFPRLLESLRDRSFHHRYLNELPVDAGDHADGQNLRRQASVEAYIALIFSHIRREDPDRIALLKAMTLVPPAQAYDNDFLTKLCDLLDFGYQQKRAELLVQLGWLQREPLAEEGVGYSIHPLILDVAFRELGVTAVWADAFIRLVTDWISYNEQDPQDKLSERRPSQPFGEHLGNLFAEAETEAVAYLLDRWATLEKTYGFYQKALRPGQRALAIAEKHLSTDIIAGCQANLANIYTDLGDFARARDLLEAALASDLKNSGPEHPNVAVTQSNLAITEKKIGNYARSRDLLEAALASDLKNFGPDHPTVATNQCILANLHSELGDYARARDLLET
ncbi:MAG: tetratricopeptide repeat protein, partial [Saprospiraceae bacterium]